MLTIGWKHKETKRESTLLHWWTSVISKSAELEPNFSEIQKTGSAPWWQDDSGCLRNFHWARLVCVPDDCRKSYGFYYKITRLWWTNSWCSIWPKEVSRERLERENFFLSQARERLVIGALLKRGQDTTSSDGFPTAKSQTCQSGGQCKEDVSPQRSGSLVNLVNDNNRKWVGQASGNWCSSSSKFEVEGSQVYRQDEVNLAREETWAEPDAVSPEIWNMRLSDHQYMEKIFQCVQKKLGELR